MIPDIIFYITASITIISAIMVIISRDIFRAALFLASTASLSVALPSSFAIFSVVSSKNLSKTPAFSSCPYYTYTVR